MLDANSTKLQQQYEGTRLAAAAYAAQDIKALLATSPSQHELTAGFHGALVKQGFSIEQANSFVEKYTPAAALDQDGAGAVLFRINGTNEIATTVRGTEYDTFEQRKNDLVLADGTIALGELPVYQTTLIANFLLRETTPAGQPVPQFSVQGGNSNVADLGRATADTLASAGGERGSASNLVTMPVLVQTGMAIGTGNAVGPCVDAAAHSEGSPEITTLGSAIAQCSRITTVNGPGVSVEQMQSVSDQLAIQANRSFQDIASQRQLNVHTSGVSVIDGLNGGLPGDSSLLNIPGNSHSSIVAMNAAEAQYKASMGEGVADYGVIEVTAPRATLDNYLNSEGATLANKQQDALAVQLDHLNIGTDKALSFFTLPGGGALIADADGDIVGEIDRSSMVDLNLKVTAINAEGNTVQVSQHINEQGKTLNDSEYADTQLQDFVQGSGLFNGLNNLQNWDHLSDVGKLSAMLGFYNSVDGLGAAFDGTGNNLPGDFAELSGWFNFVQGLESGDALIIANGINQVSDQAVDEALNSMLGSSEVPYVSALIALNNLEYNPAQSIGTLAGMYVAGPLGGAIGGFVGGAFGGLFGDDDIPMRQGLACAQWNAQGQIQIITTQDAEGGGSSANSWMGSLVDGLQTQLQSYNSQHKASDGMGLALIPNLLPSVGFKYDPDGYNLVNGARGFMYLQWTDDQGHTQTRYYDGAGNRGDGSGETLSRDFVQHAQSAIAPAWQVQTVLAHYQQSGEIDLPTQANSLPQALSDGLHQTLQVVSLGLASALPTEATPSNNLIDVDGDGYLEQTQWVQANQAILSADLNGDGQISLGETVNLQDAGQVQQARTSLAWLDVNQDARLTAQDPAFAAIRLWVDVNADGNGSAIELQSLSQAGITAIDFSTNPPRIERADGSVQILNVQTRTANTLGVAFQTTAAGLVQTTEQQDGTGQSVQYAVNTRAFDGQAARTQGGTQDVDGSKGAVVQADVGKLSSTTYKTIANVSVQTSTSVGVGDARLKSAATVSSIVTSTASSTSPETRVAFVPAGQNSAQSEVRLVTQDMIESAGSSMFGAAGLGVLGVVGMGATASAAEAAAVQANVFSAGNNANPGSNSANAVSTNNQFTATLPTTRASSNTPFSTLPTPAEVVVKQAEVFSAPVLTVQGVQTVQTAAASTTTSSNASPVFVSSTPVSALTEAAPVVVKAVVISSKTSSDSSPATSSAAATTSTDATITVFSLSANTAMGMTLDYPVVNGETLPGTEDVVLRLSQDVLLANDSTPNASADPNAPALTITAVADAVNGKVSLNDGVVVFMPNTNFHGEASFTYTVTDQYGLSTTGSTTLVIAAVNDSPVTQGETAQTQEDTTIYFNVTDLLGNDSDVDTATDGQVLNITGIAAAQNGTATLLADGRIRFVPDSNFHGTAQFTYIVNDGNETSNNGSTTATVKVDLSAVNDAPVTQQDEADVDEDTAIIITQADLLGNDSDVDTGTDGQVLSITAVSGATNGSVSMLSNGDIQFIPNANYHGAASFTYTVSDGNGGTKDASVNITVNAVNDTPVVQGESTSTNEDTTLSIHAATLLTNDSDLDTVTDEQMLSLSAVSSISGKTHGTVSLVSNADGTQTVYYTPDANYHGTASFNYTVSDGNRGYATAVATVTVAAVNDAPITLGETSSTDEDAAIVFTQADLLANDSDADTASDGQVLTITALSGATNGTVSMLASGDIQFIPNANFHGAASFTYTVSDGNGGTTDASVSITVNAVNDTPMVLGETVSTSEDIALNIEASTLLSNDSDVDTATDSQVLSLSSVSTISGKTHGTVALVNNADGTQTVQFIPDANYHGVASFNYTVSDGNGGFATAVATINIAAVNDLPVTIGEIISTDEDESRIFNQAQLLANDSDIDTATDDQVLSVISVSGDMNGSVTMLANGDIRFIPNANYHGAASFTYIVSDGNEGKTEARVNVYVLSVNDPPIAVGDLFLTQEDSAIVLTSKQLLANDTDNDIATDGDFLTISRVFDALHCTVTLNTDGTMNLVPDAQYHGNVRFSYEITDISGATSTAFVVAGVSAVNDTPVSQSDSFDGTEDTLIILEQADVLANDTDNDVLTDGDGLSVQSVGNASHGKVRLLSSGQIEFLPDANFHGSATFDYVVTDTFGATSTNTVTLSIVAVNDTPVVQGESANAKEDTILSIDVTTLLTNDSDVDSVTDGQVLSLSEVSSISGKTHGTVSLVNNADGTQSVHYTPDSNYHGTASFNYTVSDGNGGFARALATINIAGVNDLPVTIGEISSTDEDVELIFSQSQLLANDSDVDTATDDQVLSITAVSDAINGTLSLVSNSDIRFIPNANYHGIASFTYTVSDGNGGTTDASVSITVNAVNDTPLVLGESSNTNTNEDTTLCIAASTLLANDSDVDTVSDGQVLSLSAVSSISGKTHGTVRLVNSADGTQTVYYTPDANYHGTASFNYTVSDGNGGLATAVATFNIAAVNDLPVAIGDISSTNEDVGLTFTQAQLLANDSDADTDTDDQILSIISVSGAMNGSVSMLANGDIRFIPNVNYHGAASFTYTVSDGSGGTTDAIVSITVNAVNDTPLVLGESTSTDEDTTLYIAASMLLANDSDVDTITDGQVLSLSEVSSISGKTHGTVSLVNNADGTQSVHYTPDSNYHGTASFNYTVSDGNGGFASALATINIAGVNDLPVTIGEIISTDEDESRIFTQAQLLANDSDIDTATDDQVLSIISVSGDMNCSVSMLASGDIQFIPTANYHGAASFTYTVSDGNGGTTDASVSITVNAVNDTPVLQGESTNADEDTTLYIAASTLLANDSDVDTITDGQVLSLSEVSRISGKTHGTVSLVNKADGTQTVQFIPDANYHGVASFNYTVSDGNGGFAKAVATVNLAAANDTPVAVGEISSTDEDTGLTFTQTQLLANDSDVDTATDGQVLTITAVSGASNGTVSMLANGDIRFIPNANYHGAASFTYTVSDGNGGITDASVNITVDAVNDTPVVQGESTNTNEDTTLLICAAALLSNDSDFDATTDGQVLRLSSVNTISGRTHGTVTLLHNADGTQTVEFIPDANYHGMAAFSYTVSDGNGGYATAVASINLAAVNDAPVTIGETSSTNEDVGLIFTQAQLLSNDSDVDTSTDGQVLTITAVSGATNGTVSMQANGDIRFIPTANYHGTASFTYTVSDGGGGSTDARVTITVNAVNDAPVVVGEAVSTNEDTTLWFIPSDLLANDTDVDIVTDGQVLTITAVRNAVHGAVAFVTQADGKQRIAFTPDANYFGAASYQYSVTDGNGGSASATVVINLNAVNDAPDALADSVNATEDTPLILTSTSLLSNDTDVDNLHSALRIVGVSNATHGRVNLNVDGSISFNPNLDYFGVATFNYTVSDGVGGFSLGTATVNIAPVNDNPVAVGESLTLNEDETVSLTAASLLANDSDVDNSQAQLRVVSVGGAVHGSVSLEITNGNTHVVFKPELNFYGAASFNYTVSDGVGGTTDTRVELNLIGVNDIPVVNGELYVGKRDVSYSLSAAVLLANDTDVETPNSLTLSSVGNAQHGSANLVNGNIVFVPESGYSGLGSFDYVVCDADGGQATGTAQIDFSHVNVNPTVVDDSFMGTEDTVISINTAQLLANDVDSDNATGSLRVSQVGSATHGTVNLDARGNILFTPDANFNGQASFSYQVADPDGGGTWGNAWLTIASVNDAPIIEDVWYGRPVYGYHAVQVSGYDADGYYSYIRYDVVSSLNDAMSFLHSGVHLYKQQIDLVPDGEGGLQSVKNYRSYSPSYYRNGDLRPTSFDTLDATKWIDEGTTLTDDPYRQNGGVVAYDPDGDSGSLTFSISATPQHGHAWLNGYTNALAPEQQDHTQVGAYWVNQAGAWQYYSSKGDIYSGTDPFSLRVTDAGGASVETMVTTNHASWPVGGGGGGGCPLVVDLDGDGVELIAASDSHVLEDVNGDGWRERMGWVSSDDGFLALDRNGDGLIEGMKDISFAHDLPGTQTDLMGLNAHDTNDDGVISCVDSAWAKFGIWQDANSNGIQEAGEFRSLDDLGVASLALAADNKLRLEQGNVVFGETQLALTSGKSWVVADVMLAGQHVPYPTQVQDALLLQQAEVMRKALFFNQLCTTASSENDVMLGFVDTSDPVWHGVTDLSHHELLDSRVAG